MLSVYFILNNPQYLMPIQHPPSKHPIFDMLYAKLILVIDVFNKSLLLPMPAKPIKIMSDIITPSAPPELVKPIALVFMIFNIIANVIIHNVCIGIK